MLVVDSWIIISNWDDYLADYQDELRKQELS